METDNNFESFLKDQLKCQEKNIEQPALSCFDDVRRLVEKRKVTRPEVEDLISVFASFLNVKIKLYHAVLVCILLALCIFYFGKDKSSPNNEVLSGTYVSNIAAVNNSTVLSSINTFVTRK